MRRAADKRLPRLHELWRRIAGRARRPEEANNGVREARIVHSNVHGVGATQSSQPERNFAPVHRSRLGKFKMCRPVGGRQVRGLVCTEGIPRRTPLLTNGNDACEVDERCDNGHSRNYKSGKSAGHDVCGNITRGMRQQNSESVQQLVYRATRDVPLRALVQRPRETRSQVRLMKA
jgi:hypothetical protein